MQFDGARVWLVAERLAWVAGVLGLSVYTLAGVTGASAARQDVARFVTLQASRPPDFSLWSPERIRAWRETHAREAPISLAVLRIPRLALEVPVLRGTDEWTLNRAVGHIEDTAEPGGDGNSGIAGHRDGFFRGLKDVHPGDILELDTLERADVYRVDRAWIVEPDDVSVLDPTPSPSVTLVTCYPFYFVGAAPQRFIVRAVRVSSKETS